MSVGKVTLEEAGSSASLALPAHFVTRNFIPAFSASPNRTGTQNRP